MISNNSLSALRQTALLRSRLVGGSCTSGSRVVAASTTSRGLSSSAPVLPRITERRPNEYGRGGRASDAGVKVAVFGATGFLGRYVCSGL
ncbi:hypothetical protein ACHAXR_000885, partial [Thalassiosira sp. AJA248-18]